MIFGSYAKRVLYMSIDGERRARPIGSSETSVSGGKLRKMSRIVERWSCLIASVNMVVVRNGDRDAEGWAEDFWRDA